MSTALLVAHASGGDGAAPRGGLLLAGFSLAAALCAIGGVTFGSTPVARFALGSDAPGIAAALADAAARSRGRNLLVVSLPGGAGAVVDSATPHDSYVGWLSAPLGAPITTAALATLVTACPARMRVGLLSPRTPPHAPSRAALLCALVEAAFDADVAMEWNREPEGGPAARLTREFVAAAAAAGAARALGGEAAAALAGVLRRALASYARPPGLCGAGKARAAALATAGREVDAALGVGSGPPPPPQALVLEAEAFPPNLARDPPSIVLVL